MAEESEIEAGVVGDDNTVSKEIVQARQDLFGPRLACKHLIGDSMYLLNLKGYRSVDLDEAAEFFRGVAILKGNRPDLYDPVAPARGQTGRFDIEDDMAVNMKHFCFLTIMF
ncbi:MAG: hypothetical protein AVO39_09285 [delta proteobacterium MLS_D]|nr:MAG: hypothetical protein AVO39_09285 [delta proteobacterium MLS_D]